MKPVQLIRIFALLVALVYVVAATVSGGAGGLLVAVVLTVGPVIFIWFAEEVGEALSSGPVTEGVRPGRPAAWVIKIGGWLLLLALVSGFFLKGR